MLTGGLLNTLGIVAPVYDKESSGSVTGRGEAAL